MRPCEAMGLIYPSQYGISEVDLKKEETKPCGIG